MSNEVACRSRVMTYNIFGDPWRRASEEVDGADSIRDDPSCFVAEEEYPLKDSQTGKMKPY